MKIKHKYHKYANLFPLLEGEDYNNLKEDIKKNGQLEAIYLFDNQIIDGRNRYRVCLDLGIKPKIKEYGGKKEDLLSFILSLNLHRRHMSTNEKALLGVELIELFKEEAANRQKSGLKQFSSSASGDAHGQGKSSAAAGKLIGVSSSSIERTARIVAHGVPDLVDQVRNNQINLSEGYEISKHEQDIQKKILNGTFYSEEEDSFIKNKKAINTVNKGSSEWYTPKHIVELVLETFDGTIDLDPCSNSLSKPNIPAKKVFTKELDGLKYDWGKKENPSRIFINPPFNNIKEFINKTITEINNGNVDEVIYLLPNASSTEWLNLIFENNFQLCFLKKRLQFISNKAIRSSSPFGSFIAYYGNNKDKFFKVFGKVGYNFTNNN
jgi:phage N-6-adenine-methyltransferase